MSMKFKLTGAKEMDRALQELKSYTARRVGAAAAEAALQLVADDAKAAAPRSGDGQNFADTIGVGTKVVAGLRRWRSGLTREGKHTLHRFVGTPSPLAHIIEFGTVERFHKSGKSTGAMPKRPFMRPAWDANREAMVSKLAEVLRAELDKAIARAAKKSAKGGRR